MKPKSKKKVKSASRFINPEDGKYRAITQVHKSKNKYTRKTKHNADDNQ